MRELRGSRIGIVYQDPMTSLNPLMRIGDQVVEAMTAHGVPKRRAHGADARAPCPGGDAGPGAHRTLLPARVLRGHAPAGHDRRSRSRCTPRLLIADEPTTALDVTIQRQILALVNELRRELQMATIWVTHDLGVIARLVDRVVVMYAGHVVEEAPVAQLFHAPAASVHQQPAGRRCPTRPTTPGRRWPRSRVALRCPPRCGRVPLPAPLPAGA